MALRNQPYIPLYIQDYLTDEKLSLCSWQTQGIYIKILCILHKQENYGCVLFKQNSEISLNSINYFADIFIRLIPCQKTDMINCLNELISNNVLYLDEEKLYQKRMVKDFTISEERRKAGKTGGGNPKLKQDLFKQNPKQKPENENEIENEYKDNNKPNNNIYITANSENFLDKSFVMNGITSECWASFTDEQQQQYIDAIKSIFKTDRNVQEKAMKFYKINNNSELQNYMADFWNFKVNGKLKYDNYYLGFYKMWDYFTNWLVLKKDKKI